MVSDAQPSKNSRQIRLDLEDLLFDSPQHLFVGTEVRFWINKLGEPNTDELTAQALLVLRL